MKLNVEKEILILIHQADECLYLCNSEEVGTDCIMCIHMYVCMYVCMYAWASGGVARGHFPPSLIFGMLY